MGLSLHTKTFGKIYFLVVIITLLLVILQTAYSRSPVKQERMAAWHESIVNVDEVQPNGEFMTYVTDDNTWEDTYLLAKMVTSIEKDGKSIMPTEAMDIKVEDFPGGVEASYMLGDVKMHCRYIPLMKGRKSKVDDGVLLYRVSSSPCAPVVLKCGGGRRFILRHSHKYTRSNDLETGNDTVVVKPSGTAILTSDRYPHKVAIRTNGKIQESQTDNVTIRFDNGKGWVLLGFSRTDELVEKLIVDVDPDVAEKEVADYYEKTLFRSFIKTPEKVMDDAFRSALYNLEYNWLEDPDCWIEAIHHWVTSFHQEHSAAAEWIGQEDRSARCILEQVENLMDDKWVPGFYPSGTPRMSFGGSRHFFVRQVEHYWKFTAAKDLIEKMASPLDKMIDATFEKYDPEGDGVMAWSSQVGNQEDYLYHPYNSSGPTIEVINMLKVRLMVAEVLEDEKTAQLCRARITKSMSALKKELWQQDLGRFIYYKDPTGKKHLDGQYYNYTHAILWDIVDLLDGWTGLRHLQDRLTGPDGRIYVSNNFPCHIPAPGMQGNAVQQPWATFALSKMGLRNQAYIPLKITAEWVMSDVFRGSWMEHNKWWREIGYFSPPAGLYIQAVIEAVFGLMPDKPNGYLALSPCFPDYWPNAELNLPKFSASYTRKDNTIEYTVKSKDVLARKIQWSLPVCTIEKILVEGVPVVDYKILPGIQNIKLCFDTKPSKSTKIIIVYKPVDYHIDTVASIAEGDPITIRAQGCGIQSVEDRCNVLSSFSVNSENVIKGTVSTGLLDDYLKYGRLGLLNFSRRTFFLNCKTTDGIAFWHPISIAVLPRYEVAALQEIGADSTIYFVLRNNTFEPLKCTAFITASGDMFAVPVDVAARSEQKYSLVLPSETLALLSPGDNTVDVVLPNNESLSLVISAGKAAFDTILGLSEKVSNRIQALKIPESDLIADTRWREVRRYLFQWHQLPPPLESLSSLSIQIPSLPLVPFTINERKFVPVSQQYGKSIYTLPLDGKKYRKFYLLVVPFLCNHDVFSPVARISATTKDDKQITKTLYFPGHLDGFGPDSLMHFMSTIKDAKRHRFGLLASIQANQGDWDDGKPELIVDAFPQKRYWSDSRHLMTKSSVFSVIEFSLKTPVNVKSLQFSTIGTLPGFGIVAISADKCE